MAHAIVCLCHNLNEKPSPRPFFGFSIEHILIEVINCAIIALVSKEA